MLTKGNRRRGSGLWPRVSLPDCGIFRFACIFDRPRAPPPSRLAPDTGICRCTKFSVWCTPRWGVASAVERVIWGCSCIKPYQGPGPFTANAQPLSGRSAHAGVEDKHRGGDASGQASSFLGVIRRVHMWSPAHGPRQLRRSARSKNNPGVHKAVCKHLRVCTLAAAMPHAHRPSTLGTGRDTKRTGQAMCEFGALTVQVVCLGMDGGSNQMRTGSWQRALADRGGLSLVLTVAK